MWFCVLHAVFLGLKFFAFSCSATTLLWSTCPCPPSSRCAEWVHGERSMFSACVSGYFSLIWGQSTWYTHLYRGTWYNFIRSKLAKAKSSVQSRIRLSQVTHRPWLKRARIKVDDSYSEVTTQQFFHHRILRHPHWDRADRWCLKQSRREKTGSGCLGHSALHWPLHM